MKKLITLTITALIFAGMSSYASAAKILSQNTEHTLVLVEKGDSPFSAIKEALGTDGTDADAMKLLAPFLEKNHVARYNKYGNPVIIPGDTYLVPTKAGRDAQNAFIAGISALKKNTQATSIPISKDTRGNDLANIFIKIVISGMGSFLLIFLLVMVVRDSWLKRKLQTYSKIPEKEADDDEDVINRMVEETLMPEEPQNESANDAQVNEFLFGELEEPKDEGVATDKAVASAPPWKQLSEAPKIRYVIGAEGIYSEPLPAGVPSPPYPFVLGEKLFDLLLPYPMPEVVKALETIAVRNDQRGIPLCHLPTQFRKHPELAGESLQNFITLLEREKKEKQEKRMAQETA